MARLKKSLPIEFQDEQSWSRIRQNARPSVSKGLYCILFAAVGTRAWPLCLWRCLITMMGDYDIWLYEWWTQCMGFASVLCKYRCLNWWNKAKNLICSGILGRIEIETAQTCTFILLHYTLLQNGFALHITTNYSRYRYLSIVKATLHLKLHPFKSNHQRKTNLNQTSLIDPCNRSEKAPRDAQELLPRVGARRMRTPQPVSQSSLDVDPPRDPHDPPLLTR